MFARIPLTAVAALATIYALKERDDLVGDVWGVLKDIMSVGCAVVDEIDGFFREGAWTHLGLRIERAGRRVTLLLDGFPMDRWQDPARSIFQPLASAGAITVGGAVATTAGGRNVRRYGPARDSVLGLEAVLADGEVFDGLGRVDLLGQRHLGHAPSVQAPPRR